MQTVDSKSMEEYSSTYSTLGEIITDLPIIHNLPHLIASLLPNYYRAVNLGSGTGRDTERIQAECKAMGKEGVFIDVDPFINKEGVVKMTSEEFMAQAQNEELDFILCKYSLHFNKDHPTFFRNVHRCLKLSGKMLIHQMARESRLPWTETIAQRNRDATSYAQDVVPADLFTWQVLEETKVTELDRQMFKKAIVSRTWASLLLCSEAEI